MESRALLTLACVALLSACATPRYQEAVGHAGYLGLGLCPAKDGLSVVSVNAGSPAERARFKEGDVIVGEGDLDLRTPEGRRSLLWAIHDDEAGNRLDFRVERRGRLLVLKARPQERDVYAKDALYSALTEEIVSGGKVSVAVIPRVTHTRPEFFDNADALAAWQNGMSDSLDNTFESLLLNKLLLRCGNYGVADRAKTQEVFKELKFQNSGAVSPETAKELGRLVGASHLLFLDMTRFQQASGAYQDEISARLVAVESGTVLTSAKFEQSVSR